MDKLKTMIQDIKAGWEEMERRKRIRLVGIVSTALIFILLFTYFTQRTNYQVLFNDLEDADAGTIVDDLESKGMKYKLENDGSTILIAEDEIDNYRIKLAVEGLLPTTSTGFEIFDGSNMMATDDDRAIMYQRAISGELERAVSSLDTINSAQILLNIPEDSVFQNPEYRKDASASVVLDIKTNQPLSMQTIQGIASLVSGAIDNLPIENVRIVDTNGNLLSNSLSGGANDATVVGEHQRIKRSIETDLENKVLNLLGAIYGHDKVFVTVNTQLNFDAIEQENIEYNVPETSETDRGLIRSQQEQATGNSGISRVEGSTLDGNNVTEFIEEGEDGDNSSYDHTTNYELDSSTSHIIRAPGTVENITASVVVNGRQGGTNPELLVRNALGITADLENGNIEIEFVEPAPADDDTTILSDLSFLPKLVSWATANWWIILLGLFGVIGLIVGIRLFLNRRRNEELIEEEIEEPVDIVSIETEEPSEEEISEEMKEKQIKRELSNEKEDAVREEAKENPELVAELIKIWLKEEE